MQDFCQREVAEIRSFALLSTKLRLRMGFSTQDIAILAVALLATVAYYFVYSGKKTTAAMANGNGMAKAALEATGSTGRDFVAAMEKAVSRFAETWRPLRSTGFPSPSHGSLLPPAQSHRTQ